MINTALFSPTIEESCNRPLYRYWRIRIMYSMMIGYAGFIF